MHNRQLFESSSIVKANPATFEFRVNLLLQNDAQVLFKNLLDPVFSDLYFQTSHATFKIDDAIFTNGTFEIARNSLLKLSIASSIGSINENIPGQSS